VGLASMCAVKVLANTLYAFHDTWTPVKSAAVALLTNVVINCVLVVRMKLPGLALATSLSSTMNSYQLYQAVKKRIGPFDSKMRYWIARVALASAGMGAVSLTFWNVGLRMIGLSHFVIALAWLIATILCGLISFFLFGVLLSVDEARQVTGWFARKKNSSRPN